MPDKARVRARIVREGAAAAADGKGVEQCPYWSRVEAREAWMEGHASAKPADRFQRENY